MAIPQIQPYDYFHQWRSKTNLISSNIGDIETINVSPGDKDSIVEAINKVISNIGVLSTLTTTAKNTIVAAINEHQTKIGNGTLTTVSQIIIGAINELDGYQGDLTSLTTTVKTNLVAAVNELDGEHGTLSSLQTSNKSTFVVAINELFDKIGPLASLNTTAKDNLVDAVSEVQTELGNISALTTSTKTSAVEAINEHDGEIGTIANLTTTDKTNLVASVNELVTKLSVGDAEITVGSETSDVIRVTVQLKNSAGANLAVRANVFAYLSEHNDGSSLIGTAHSGGWAIGTSGLLISDIDNKSARFTTSATGAFNIDITETGSKTAYLVVVLPLGTLKISSAITHA